MKAISVVAMLLITAASLVLGQSKAKKPDGASDSTVEAVRQLHGEIVEAQLTSDTATLDLLGAHLNVSDAECLEIHSGGRKLEAFGIADVEVRAYGDTAVVTSRATLKGQRQGLNISGQYRGIDVYVKKQGRWQVVAAQATRIAQP